MFCGLIISLYVGYLESKNLSAKPVRSMTKTVVVLTIGAVAVGGGLFVLFATG